MQWSDVSVSKNETSLAATMKDPDEARGRSIKIVGMFDLPENRSLAARVGSSLAGAGRR